MTISYLSVFVLACLSLASGQNLQIDLFYDQNSLFTIDSKVSNETLTRINNSFRGRVTTPLPKNNVLPVHYDIELIHVIDELDPYMKNSVLGKIAIRIVPVVNTKEIVLNALDINVDPESIYLKPIDENDETEFIATGRDEQEEHEFYIVELDNEAIAGKEYLLTMEFLSLIATSKLNGIYRSDYTDPETGENKTVIATQFQATAARQAFPCFDEPWIKATFKIAVGYDSNRYIALSNGDKIQETQIIGMPEGWLLAEFEETVKMSTYLVALTVAEDFDYEEAPSELYPKPVKIYGPSYSINSGKGGVYSAKTVARSLSFFEDYFEIEYKMSKLDSIALPQFFFGAMENWGLNTYRRALLLNFDGVSTEAEREATTNVIAHEILHQWIGNFVTCEYWDEIWLNEGSAVFFEPKAVSVVASEFESIENQFSEMNQLALAYDATPATHPIVNSANGNQSYDTIMEYFDRITYQKGGSLLRMIEAFLTADTFKKAILKYIDSKSFQSATQNELFELLTEQGHIDGTFPRTKTVKNVMETWTFQSGFPLLRVSRLSSTELLVSQERFIDDVKYSPQSPLNPNDLWTIPVTTITKASHEPNTENLRPKFWIEKDEFVKVVDNINTNEWFLFNMDGVGYFRTLYEKDMLKMLVELIEVDPTVLTPMTKQSLMDDYFAFWNHDLVTIEEPMSLTRFLGTEIEAVVWTTAISYLREIFNKMSGTENFSLLKEYLEPRFAGALDLIGLEQLPEDKGRKVILRSQLLDWSCSLGNRECRKYANHLYEMWNPAQNPIPVDIRPVVYCSAVAEDIGDIFNVTLARYQSPYTTKKDKALLLSALTCQEHFINLNTVVESIISSTPFIAPADTLTFLEKMAANPTIRQNVTDFIEMYTVALVEKHGAALVANYFATASQYLGSIDEYEQIKRVLDANDAILEGFEDVFANALKTVNDNILWRRKNQLRLEIWLNDNNIFNS